MGHAPPCGQGEAVKRLHIVGCPRSGTTLLMELVATCFDSGGYCEHELSIFEPVEGGGDIYFTKQLIIQMYYLLVLRFIDLQ